jgi:hypothetical protein
VEHDVIEVEPFSTSVPSWILGLVVLPVTYVAVEWTKDNLDCNHKEHSPIWWHLESMSRSIALGKVFDGQPCSLNLSRHRSVVLLLTHVSTSPSLFERPRTNFIAVAWCARQFGDTWITC